MMSDCFQLGMMFPFILNRFLKSQHFKQSEIDKFWQQTGIAHNDLAIKHWIKCWIVMAKTMAIAFKSSFTKDDYEELHQCLDNERRFLSQV